jgi:hypothetical protein
MIRNFPRLQEVEPMYSLSTDDLSGIRACFHHMTDGVSVRLVREFYRAIQRPHPRSARPTSVGKPGQSALIWC